MRRKSARTPRRPGPAPGEASGCTRYAPFEPGDPTACGSVAPVPLARGIARGAWPLPRPLPDPHASDPSASFSPRGSSPLAPAAVLAGVPIAPMTFGATFFSTDAGPSGIRGRGRGRGRGPELHGVEVQLAHPLVGDGRPIVTSGHPPSPGLRQCPTFQKISEAASSAKRVARFDLTLGSQRRPKSRGVWRETVAGCDPESRAARRVRVQRSVHFKR